MPAFKHAVTGALLSVSESTAANLDPSWTPVDAAPEPEVAEAESVEDAPAKRTRASK